MSWREKIKSLLHNLTYVKQERGAIFVLTALLLPVLFGFMGFAYDVGNLYMHKARLQNVTDAAALAGAGVFKNPPNKETADTSIGEYVNENNEVVDKNGQIVKLKQKVDYKSGTQILEKEGGSVVTVNSPNHVKADLEAKSYIEHNAVNLGNPITTEELSALAYNDSKTTKVNGTPTTSGNTTTTINTETTKVTDATFYRVIASEEVPLYFLPVILGENKRTQTVRTTSVAMVEHSLTTQTGEKIEVTGDGGNPPTPKTNTILDNLFTFTDYLDITKHIDQYSYDGAGANNIKVLDTFDGDVVFTGTGNANDPDTAALHFDGDEGYKYLLVSSGAKAYDGKNRLVEILDSNTYYAVRNNSVNIADSQTLQAFNSVFDSDAVILTKLTASEMNKELKKGKNGSRIFIDGASTIDSNNRCLVIDEPLYADKGDENKPVYFMFKGNHQFKIKVEKSNKRPIVVVWSNNETNQENLTFENWSDNVEFNAVIYSPYRMVQNDISNRFTFNGTIIAKKLELHGSKAEYHHVDYITGDTAFTKPLPTINEQSKTITQAIYNQYFAASLDHYANNYDSSLSNMGSNAQSKFKWIQENFSNPNALKNARDVDEVDADPPTKKYILKAWAYTYARTISELRKAYPNFQLSDLNGINKSPWDVDTSSSQTGETQRHPLTFDPEESSQFRLINPRTETNPYFAPDSDI